MQRRQFLKDMSAVTATVMLGQATMQQVQAAVKKLGDLPPGKVASDELFWREIQQSFSVSRSVINLNNAGLCASPRVVTQTVVDHTWDIEKLPSHTAFTILPDRIETVRAALARELGCDAEELAIVRNATEALQTILMGVPLKKGDEVLTTDHDYWAMLDALEQRQLRDGIVVKKVSVPTPAKKMQDLVDIFEKGISSKTRLILVSHPVNLTGQFFPIKEICEMAHAKGIEVVVDAAQSFGQTDYKMNDLKCDYFGTSLHKWMMGPKGTGLLYVRRDKIEKVWPLLPPPRKLNSDVRKFEALGTIPSYSLAIGEAVAFHNGIGAKRKEERFRYLTHYWAKRLQEIPGVHFSTNFDSDMSCAIATFRLKGIEPGDLQKALWHKHQIMTANASKRVKSVQGVRVSVGLQTTLQELDTFCEVVESIARKGLAG